MHNTNNINLPYTKAAKNLQTKKGYKQTKLGWIPVEWTTPPISEVFEFIHTASFSRNDINYDIKNDSIYYIHYGDIHATYKNAILDFDTENRIPVLKDKVSTNTSLLKEGDLIIADASEDYEGVGEALEVFNIGNKKAISGLHTFALRDKDNKTAHGYRAYLFKNLLVKNALKTIATGSKVYGISKGNLQKFKIVLPPIAEQQKIAQILSTWDRAINLQKQLITQKQALKKGLMQILLTGKKRFGGFSGEWEEYFLKDIANFNNGKGHEKNIDKNGKFIVVNSKFISTAGRIKKFSNNAFSPLNKGDIVLVMSDIPNGKALAKTFLIDTENKYTLNQRICSLKVKKGFSSELLYYKLNRNNYFLRYNDGVKQTNLRKDDVLFCTLSLPDQKEQQKIADVLSAADIEINKLQEQLNQLQLQKRGLMQVLLSGEVRVKI